ncbi:hypothetical protein E4U58_004246 [Claviceps cyperi]|nr:hypothetical protein E4U58_004246 [Claviceps cyperi]
MAPGTRRANRSGYAEHDDFEGLPVRQWRQDWVNLAPPAPQEQAQKNDIWAIELIHGMPKDSNLLAPHSQELLRAARSGRLYKRPAPPEDDEADIDAGQVAEKADKKEEDHAGQGFSIKLWKQIPRSSEGSGPTYLAERRKGTVTIASKTVDEKTTPGSTVTRATVRKTDAAGNPYTEEVTLADGQHVVGEIISTRVEAVQTAAGDGFAAPAPALRRRPPPPKRKSKAGPGRGKKKVKTELPGQGLAAGVAQTAGEVRSVSVHGPGAHGMPHEVTGTSNRASENAEVEDDDEDDDEDGDGDGDGGEDEGEDDEEGDQQMNDADESKVHDIEMTDAPEEQRPVTPNNNQVVDLDAADGMITQIGTTSSNPFTLAPAIGNLATHSPRNEGSPLKNVRFQSKSQSQSPAPTDSQAAPAVSTDPAKGVPNSSAATEAITVEMPSLDAVMSEASAAETRTESMIAEPPSMAAGDEGIRRIDEDVVMTEAALDEAPMEESQGDVQQCSETRPELDRFSPNMAQRGDALLPPPPEQVGNITSPSAYERPERTSDCDEKDGEGHAHELHMHDDRTATLHVYDSIITEDTIQPEDSASIQFPLTESGAPSEIGAASAGETKSSAAAEAPRQTSPSPSRPTSPTADTNMDAASATDPTGDRPMTLEHDEPNVSQGSSKDSSGVIPVSPEAPPAVQPTQSPAALQHISTDASREPTPVQAVQSEEQASPLEDAVQDNPLSRVDDPLPQQSDEVVTQEEPTLDHAVEIESVPETSQIEKKPAASGTGQDAKMDPEDKREEVAESRMDEDPKTSPQEQSEALTTSDTNEDSKINRADQKEESATSSTSEDAKANQEEQRDEPIQKQQQDSHNERVGSPTEESKSQSQALSLDPDPSSEAVSGPVTTEPIDPEVSTTDDAVAAAAPSSPPVLPPTTASSPAPTADGAGEGHSGAADGPAEATTAAAAAVVEENTEDVPAGV